ncbi:LexA family transcriptional regulator [Sphingopyxis sp. J-6]|uniref:helix-turn-helix domain-containing protein n=1 Tax=Sphingopyxis sp. J-6 TaxID=3122054 RepID=UPI003983EA5F
MLRQLREALGLSQEVIADRLGCSVSQVSRWEAGRSNIPSERLPELARAYEARVADIFQDDDGKMVPLGPQIPIRGKVAAGVWAEAWDITDQGLTMMGRADSDVPLRDRFGVIVEGDSMSEKYPSGTFLDCVAFYANIQIQSGRRVIVQRRNLSGEIEVTVKEYRIDDDGIEWLVPRSHNPSFQAFRVDQPGDDIEEVQIVGVVIGAYLPE